MINTLFLGRSIPSQSLTPPHDRLDLVFLPPIGAIISPHTLHILKIPIVSLSLRLPLPLLLLHSLLPRLACPTNYPIRRLRIVALPLLQSPPTIFPPNPKPKPSPAIPSTSPALQVPLFMKSTPPMRSGYSPFTYLPYPQNPTADCGSSTNSIPPTLFPPNPNPKPSPIPSFSPAIPSTSHALQVPSFTERPRVSHVCAPGGFLDVALPGWLCFV